MATVIKVINMNVSACLGGVVGLGDLNFGLTVIQSALEGGVSGITAPSLS